MNYSLRGHPVSQIRHTYAKSRLYITEVPGSIIPLDGYDKEAVYYVKCNKFGFVDWEDTQVITKIVDLIIRDNVFFVDYRPN
jgi:hypothetical protein